MTVFKICLVALCALSIILIVRQYKPDYGVFISLCAGIAVLTYALSQIVPIFEFASAMAEDTSFSDYFGIMLKAVGIGIVSSFTCELLRDAGETSLASKVELCAKAAILLLALPVFSALINGAIGNVQTGA
ncbi:MAG: stage III sporulation AC/AD family protein [Oscillospiraceae bacterium]|nr:stage III sporulation AC/AD family protein [Oscillospiraceae bacterium]